jgi:hypothetical protein
MFIEFKRRPVLYCGVFVAAIVSGYIVSGYIA